MADSRVRSPALLSHGAEPSALGGRPHDWIRLSLAATGAAALVSLVAPAAPVSVRAAIYLVGMVGLNLPHGAVENWLNLVGRPRVRTAGYAAAFLAGVAAFAAVLLAWPVAGVLLAMAIATAKAGSGDLAVMAQVRGAAHLRGPVHRLLAGVTRGGAVMALPLTLHPGAFDAFAGIMVATVDPAAMGSMGATLAALRPWLGIVWAGAALAHLGLGVVSAWHDTEARRPWGVDVLETAVLAALFAAAPPLIAVGVYFPLWYSARQTARALAAAPDAGARRSRARRTRGAWLGLIGLLAGTLATAALLAAVLPHALPSGQWLADGVALWTLIISAVALPHVVLAGWLDRAPGIWHTAA